MPFAYTLHQATINDRPALSWLVEAETHLHRHLDWRAALDWLGSQPFWLLEQEGRLKAALACPPDPKGIYWIRLFVCSYLPVQQSEVWHILFSKAFQQVHSSDHALFAALPLSEWFEELLTSSDFYHQQDIVVLEWDGILPAHLLMPSGVTISTMQMEDLNAVQQVDELSFAPLWQNSLESLRLAFKQSLYATVARYQGRIIGYQISTKTPLGVHLARLAVHPELRRLKIGYALVHDLQTASRQQGWRIVSVNTQSDNSASLALYQRLGFIRTGEKIPVFTFPA
jgi:[ribosomal protein S18]-alanine N-acetyltransferase